MEKNNTQIIAVVGPTATGKTKKALGLAEEALANDQYAGVDLISVDSRQVYQGLEVLTGADVPEGFGRVETPNPTKLAGKQVQSDAQTVDQSDRVCFANDDGSIRIFGISIIKPSDEWSVAHFRQMAREIIGKSWAENRLVILVGGTGLYYKHLFSDDPQLAVPPNPELRLTLEKLSIDSLQERLEKIDPEKLAQMNASDRVNKRRLIRAIEVECNTTTTYFDFAPISAQHDDEIQFSNTQVKQIFLALPLAELQKKINLRVLERFEGGAIEEVRQLLELSLPSSAPVSSTLGVPEITQYIQNKFTANECQQLWTLHEYQYAKRQLTWWKKSSSDILSLAV